MASRTPGPPRTSRVVTRGLYEMDISTPTLRRLSAVTAGQGTAAAAAEREDTLSVRKDAAFQIVCWCSLAELQPVCFNSKIYPVLKRCRAVWLCLTTERHDTS
jgi:hypothetical protein